MTSQQSGEGWIPGLAGVPSPDRGSKSKIIAIDGPSGVGKSTVAKMVARELGLPYLDTGKLYRAVGLFCFERGADLSVESSVTTLLPTLELDLADGAPLINGKSTRGLLESEEAGRRASFVSRYASVRALLVQFQQEWGHEHGGVLEGRDIGLRVFPDTPYKFFLHATEQVRIYRRALQVGADLADTAEDMLSRDARDKNRELDPLKLLPDHFPIDTSSLSIEEVVAVIVDLVGMKETQLFVI